MLQIYYIISGLQTENAKKSAEARDFSI
jgi:hypothetical protein